MRTQFTLKFAVDASNVSESFLQQLSQSKSKLLEAEKPTLKIPETEIVLKAGKSLSGIGKNAKVTVALQQVKSQGETQSGGLNCLNFTVHPDEATSSKVDDLSARFTSK